MCVCVCVCGCVSISVCVLYVCLFRRGQCPGELAYDTQHHFISSTSNGEKPDISEKTADINLVGVPHASPVLETGVCHLSG